LASRRKQILAGIPRRKREVSEMIAAGELQHALCIAAFAISGVHKREI
jgi:hypothetical protein